MYKCIIIDDEERSIENLSNYIAQYPNLEVIEQYSQPLLALTEISQMEKVDLIFMDVDMPTLTGIELAKMIRHKTDRLIFTTAYSKYAFDAYELQAEAYLLKPFSFAKFAEEVNRVLPLKNINNETKARNDDFILIKPKEENNSIIKVDFKDIIIFESFGNYIKIYTSLYKEPIVSYLTLKDILNLFTERNITYFLQVHRAFIISLKHFKSINGNMIVMNNGESIQTGGHFKDSIKLLIEKDLVTTSRKASK